MESISNLQGAKTTTTNTKRHTNLVVASDAGVELEALARSQVPNNLGESCVVLERIDERGQSSIANATGRLVQEIQLDQTLVELQHFTNGLNTSRIKLHIKRITCEYKSSKQQYNKQHNKQHKQVECMTYIVLVQMEGREGLVLLESLSNCNGTGSRDTDIRQDQFTKVRVALKSLCISSRTRSTPTTKHIITNQPINKKYA
jgi:hypothetical protein